MDCSMLTLARSSLSLASLRRSAQMMQKKIAKQQEQEKIAYNELRREAAASAQASLELPSLPSLPSVSLPSLPF